MGSVVRTTVENRRKGDVGPGVVHGLLPEGPSLDPFRTEAARRTGQSERHLRGAVATLLWANADHDYAGAVSFEGHHGPEVERGYKKLTEAELGEIVAQEARLRRERTKPQRPERDPWNKSALAGMRGKVTATPVGGVWWMGQGGALDTWIVKHEDRRDLPGEAGVEAIMQRALERIGVPAARTLSRVIGTEQCVLSERSDRYAGGDEVKPRHQEDFLQASGWSADKKYQSAERGEPLYPALYRLLEAHARRPEEECDKLTALIAACVFAGNADMHRKNIGLLHARPGEEEGVVLAPVYDFASWPGLERTIPSKHWAVPELAIGVNGVRDFAKVGPKQWIAVAEEAGLDVDWTLDRVRRTGEALPEALAEARDEARGKDENKEQGWVDRRVEATIAGVRGRASQFETRLEGLYTKTSRRRPAVLFRT